MKKRKLVITEKEYQNIIKNKIDVTANKAKGKKISILPQEEDSGEKRKKTTTYDIIKQNKEATFKTSISDEHFSVVFYGARLLSINQIFALLQSKKYEIFNYKKSWHEIIKKILTEQYWELKSKQLNMPFFESNVEITIFRQAPRLVDEDALTTMFKYIIDAFKKTDSNGYGILKEDNPKIVHKIECYSEKGDYCVGIRIKQIKNIEKEVYNSDKILLP